MTVLNWRRSLTILSILWGGLVAQEFEGIPGDPIENHAAASAVLRIALVSDDPGKIAFGVENTGEHDILIHALSYGNNELSIRRPDGTFWKNDISKETKYIRIKPGQSIVHSKLPVREWFEGKRLTAPGFYEIQWIVDKRWKSNSVFFYIPPKE